MIIRNFSRDDRRWWHSVLVYTVFFISLLFFVACDGAAIEEPAATADAAVATESVPTPEQQPTEPAAEPTEPAEEPTESAAAEPTAEAVDEQMIKIGVLNPTTGILAFFGEQVNEGIQLYFDSLGNEVAGTPVELIFADTAGDPQQALDQARRLVQQEEVDFLLGIVNSGVVVPMAQFAQEEETPLIIAVGGAASATGPERSPFVFRTGMANGQQDRVLGWYAVNELNLTRAATFAWDFLAGEERVNAFSDTFTAAGGEIVDQQKPPLGTVDYGPFISQVDPESVDVIYSFFSGPGGVAFVQQMEQFGLTPGLQIVEPGFMASPEALEAMGDAASGIVQAAPYTAVIDNPENENFLALYDETFGGVPDYYVEEGYLAANAASLALEAIGGNMSEQQPFLDALAELQFEGPSGTVSFDDHGQAIRDVYLVEVVAQDGGGLGYEVLDSVVDVSQEWTP